MHIYFRQVDVYTVHVRRHIEIFPSFFVVRACGGSPEVPPCLRPTKRVRMEPDLSRNVPKAMQQLMRFNFSRGAQFYHVTCPKRSGD